MLDFCGTVVKEDDVPAGTIYRQITKGAPLAVTAT